MIHPWTVVVILTYQLSISSGGINDEADSASTKKRHALYEEALKPVQKYFRESDRLVEVDVSSMSHERIWSVFVVILIHY